ncbi:MAG: transcriptional regulator GcvA [Alphaproteobacteria bacterium]|jgi:LysR family glycine cleavage system transcriptional activator|nr:transcriptional regulator GcvA [Alphaproteobacteria bacterium]MDP6566090.1 transcriptional regulator GcvA [Alphaproteobacteria bacterium]MDP6812916.1 transcriptional regulator GcvA [Alphaproteobacteria bacterium]
MKPLPSLRGLHAFEAAARGLSFTRAARELHVTQTAISHQIRRLEEQLATRLFHRNGRRLTLTAQGRRLLPAVQGAFEMLRGGVAELHASGANAPLTVNTLTSFATKWLVPRLAGFQAQHPDIEVRITTSTELTDFATDEVDVAIRYGRGVWPGLRADKLLAEDVFPVCAPKLLRDGPALRQPDDLRRHTLLHVSAYRDDWRTWLLAAGIDGVDPARGPMFDLMINTLGAAIDGMGVALGRGPLVADDLAAGRLVAPLPMSLPSEAAYYLVAPEVTAERPAIAAFRAWLLAEVAGASAAG